MKISVAIAANLYSCWIGIGIISVIVMATIVIRRIKVFGYLLCPYLIFILIKIYILWFLNSYMKDRLLWAKRIFYSLIVVFVLLVGWFIAVNELDLAREFFMIAGMFAFLFLILGIVLIALVWRLKIEKKLKTFLFLTGGSAILFLVSVLLHNFFYALAIYFSEIVVLKAIFEILHAGFFLVGILGCPVVFLVGVVGSFWCFWKK